MLTNANRYFLSDQMIKVFPYCYKCIGYKIYALVCMPSGNQVKLYSLLYADGSSRRLIYSPSLNLSMLYRWDRRFSYCCYVILVSTVAFLCSRPVFLWYCLISQRSPYVATRCFCRILIYDQSHFSSCMFSIPVMIYLWVRKLLLVSRKRACCELLSI